MELPGKSFLKKAFLAATATSAIALSGCAVVPTYNGGVAVVPLVPQVVVEPAPVYYGGPVVVGGPLFFHGRDYHHEYRREAPPRYFHPH